MLKILHTSDWHIGKQLYRVSLDEELQLFFNWMTEYIEMNEITHLIVSGDIYDLANPSNASRSIYFEVLRKLIALNIIVVITAGNHDSVGQLEAAKDILEMLNIHIVAAPDPAYIKQLIPIKDESGQIRLVICAVPFLRDAHLRRSIAAQSTDDRVTMLNESLLAHYASLEEKAHEIYGPEMPLIAMGHLHLVGAALSDSEREIQIGNISGTDQSRLENMFDFMALGHIHRPKAMSKGNLIYSGSPVPLSFSEKTDSKRVVVYEFNSEGILAMHSIPIPLFRQLVKLSGTFGEIKDLLNNYKNEFPLDAFFELEIIEIDFDIALLAEINEYVLSFDRARMKILSHKTRFTNQDHANHLLFIEGRNLEDLAPKEILQKKLDAENVPDEMQKPMLEVFDQLLEEYYQAENLSDSG